MYIQTFTCVRAHVCADAHICVYTCVRKSEVHAELPLPSVSILYIEAGSPSIEPIASSSAVDALGLIHVRGDPQKTGLHVCYICDRDFIPAPVFSSVSGSVSESPKGPG